MPHSIACCSAQTPGCPHVPPAPACLLSLQQCTECGPPSRRFLAWAVLSRGHEFVSFKQFVPGVKVHRGFLNQFSSFTTDPRRQEDNMTAVLLSLSGGAQPWRVVVSGAQA